MRKSMLGIAGFVMVLSIGLLVYWRWFPRAGTRWANEVANPWLVRQGWSGGGESEVGTLEHIGRTTGTRHLTPVHPVSTAEGFRIVVPLAEASQWAMNVLAAGHCRLQLHDTVHELDEPLLVDPVDVRDLPAPNRWVASKLGFKYLRLRRYDAYPGALEAIDSDVVDAIDAGAPKPTPLAPPTVEAPVA